MSEDYVALDAEVEAAIASRSVPQKLQIALSEGAVVAARELGATPEHVGRPLRVYIEGKGCDGFFYGVSFDEVLPHDLTWEQDGIRLVVDPEAFRFICGSQVEWVDDERGRGFLVENPRHRRFRGKFYKKSVWKDRLTASAGKPGPLEQPPEV